MKRVPDPIVAHTPMTLNGYKVVVSKPTPRQMLSDKVPVSDEFRQSFNAWLNSFFGMNDPLVPKGQVYTFGKYIFLHPDDYVKLEDGRLNDYSMGALL